MTDYRKMYIVLCAAIDGVIDPLDRVTEAAPYVRKLKRALLEAEEIYIETSEEKNQ